MFRTLTIYARTYNSVSPHILCIHFKPKRVRFRFSPVYRARASMLCNWGKLTSKKSTSYAFELLWAELRYVGGKIAPQNSSHSLPPTHSLTQTTDPKTQALCLPALRLEDYQKDNWHGIRPAQLPEWMVVVPILRGWCQMSTCCSQSNPIIPSLQCWETLHLLLGKHKC